MIDEGRYHKVFTERYLFPMASAVWSMSLDSIRSFPALTLLRFFHNHGMLGINTHPKWKVIRGGSHKYIPLLTAPFKERIFLDARIASVSRQEERRDLELRGSPSDGFDQVVFACHGDQVLPLLQQPTGAERDVLGNFKTSRNVATLHTDASAAAQPPSGTGKLELQSGTERRIMPSL